MWNPNEPDIFNSEKANFQTSDSFKESQADFTGMSEEEFQYHYKATKSQYNALVSAMRELQKINEALQEMDALNIDPEILENTVILIEDYTHLLEQMHSASYWERQGKDFL